MNLNQIKDSNSSNSSHEVEDSMIEEAHSNLNENYLCNYYATCKISLEIIKAILLDDIITVQELLKIPNVIDSRDSFDNSLLHIASMDKNLKMINILVSHTYVNLESKNNAGETALMKSIGKTSDAIIIKLLDAGCDIHTKDFLGRTPLQQALEFQQTIVEELLKRGADLNSSWECGGFPLFYAIKISNLELVCMLLYYNADTSIRNKENITPFLYSLDGLEFDVRLAYEILPYVVDFSITNSDGLNCLSVAIQNQHPIVLDILEVINYKSLNQVDFKGNSVLYYSLFYRTNVIFKELFSRIDHNILLKSRRPFLRSMLRKNGNDELLWLESIYLVASSNVFADLVNICLNHFYYISISFFSFLLYESYFFFVFPEHREELIYIFLSFGAQSSLTDIINFYEATGICNAIYIFLSFANCVVLPVTTSSSFLPYLLGQEVRKSYTDLKKDIIAEIAVEPERLLNLLNFFTFRFLSTYVTINCNAYIDITEIGLEKFQIPSLLELCRNEVRFTIRSAFEITTPNKFYETVEKLKIPKRIKNLILFKTPLRYSVSVCT